MRQITQANRLFHLDTPLGEDKLIVRTFEGTECVSGNFDFKLTCASEDWELDFEQIMAKNVTVGMKQSDGSSERYFNGFVKSFRQITAPGRLAMYYCEIVPWTWFLTLTQDCRIFQNMSIPDILDDTFQRFGFQDYEINVAEHDEWDYCVQYRETAFHFINRLMEIEGIYYYFKHEQGKHTMIVIDDLSSQENCPFESTYRFDRVSGPGYKHGSDTIYDWVPKKHLQTGKYAHKEYNYLKPDDPMYGDMDAQTDERPDTKLEIYDYPGEYDFHQEADEWVRWRIQEQEVDYDTAHGSSNCRSMIAGYQFDFTDHYRQDQNRSYLVRTVSHTAQEGTLIGGSDAQEAHYENSFTCMPADVQYRHPRKTPKPLMKGSQTAFVVGPKGEEIYTDDKGRVKVKFHWDRISPGDENSSCWIRIMQQWTGKQWGQIWIPRIGQEVIVDFLEGDPDRPLITGCVYNEDNMPPYKLPDNKTVSGVQTRSSKGGTDQNYNEIKLEDKIGEEMINIQAEKDMNTLVKHDQTLTVWHDKTSLIQHDMATEVDHDMSTLVKHDKAIEVDHDLSILVQNDFTFQIQNNLDLSVQNDQRTAVQGKQSLSITGDQNSSIQGNRSGQVQGDDQLKVNGNVTIQASGDIYLKASGKIVLQGMEGITFVGGSGSIDLGMSGITIEAPMVYINCGGGSPDDAPDANPDAPDQPGGFDGVPPLDAPPDPQGNASSSSSSGSGSGDGSGSSDGGSGGGSGSSGGGSGQTGSDQSGGTSGSDSATTDSQAPLQEDAKSGQGTVTWADAATTQSEPINVQVPNSLSNGTTVSSPTNPQTGNVQKVQGTIFRNPDRLKVTRIWTSNGKQFTPSWPIVIPLK